MADEEQLAEYRAVCEPLFLTRVGVRIMRVGGWEEGVVWGCRRED